ncbi:hypothetical protein GW915_12885 [bacterium]|nr:hypothetical protein [bacterium]
MKNSSWEKQLAATFGILMITLVSGPLFAQPWSLEHLNEHEIAYPARPSETPVADKGSRGLADPTKDDGDVPDLESIRKANPQEAAFVDKVSEMLACPPPSVYNPKDPLETNLEWYLKVEGLKKFRNDTITNGSGVDGNSAPASANDINALFGEALAKRGFVSGGESSPSDSAIKGLYDFIDEYSESAAGITASLGAKSSEERRALLSSKLQDSKDAWHDGYMKMWGQEKATGAYSKDRHESPFVRMFTNLYATGAYNPLENPACKGENGYSEEASKKLADFAKEASEKRSDEFKFDDEGTGAVTAATQQKNHEQERAPADSENNAAPAVESASETQTPDANEGAPPQTDANPGVSVSDGNEAVASAEESPEEKDESSLESRARKLEADLVAKAKEEGMTDGWEHSSEDLRIEARQEFDKLLAEAKTDDEKAMLKAQRGVVYRSIKNRKTLGNQADAAVSKLAKLSKALDEKSQAAQDADSRAEAKKALEHAALEADKVVRKLQRTKRQLSSQVKSLEDKLLAEEDETKKQAIRDRISALNRKKDEIKTELDPGKGRSIASASNAITSQLVRQTIQEIAADPGSKSLAGDLIPHEENQDGAVQAVETSFSLGIEKRKLVDQVKSAQKVRSEGVKKIETLQNQISLNNQNIDYMIGNFGGESALPPAELKDVKERRKANIELQAKVAAAQLDIGQAQGFIDRATPEVEKLLGQIKTHQKERFSSVKSYGPQSNIVKRLDADIDDLYELSRFARDRRETEAKIAELKLDLKANSDYLDQENRLAAMAREPATTLVAEPTGSKQVDRTRARLEEAIKANAEAEYQATTKKLADLEVQLRKDEAAAVNARGKISSSLSAIYGAYESTNERYQELQSQLDEIVQSKAPQTDPGLREKIKAMQEKAKSNLYWRNYYAAQALQLERLLVEVDDQE